MLTDAALSRGDPAYRRKRPPANRLEELSMLLDISELTVLVHRGESGKRVLCRRVSALPARRIVAETASRVVRPAHVCLMQQMSDVRPRPRGRVPAVPLIPQRADLIDIGVTAHR